MSLGGDVKIMLPIYSCLVSVLAGLFASVLGPPEINPKLVSVPGTPNPDFYGSAGVKQVPDHGKLPDHGPPFFFELEVKVNFTIDENGYVKDVDFPPIKYHRNYFKSSVRYAMEKWRFIPAQHNGEAVESEMSKIFSFSLEK